MKSRTKNTITRQSIQKELLFLNSASLRLVLPVGAFTLLLFLPIAIAITCGLIAQSEALALKIVLITLLDGILLSPVFVLVCSLIQIILERQRIKRGNFDILLHKLSEKRERLDWSRRQKRIRYEFCFEGFLPYRPDYTIYQLAEREDDFYIVRVGGKRTIRLLYPTKIYEFKKDND